MLRAIAAIVVGYLVFAVPSFLLFRVTQHDPHAPAALSFEVFAIVCGIAFALLGGYLGMVIGQRLWVGFTIAGILAAGALSSMIATGISWSPMAALVCMAPAVVVGAWLRSRQQSSR